MESLELSSATMSRTVQTLGKIHFNKRKEGLDLIQRDFDTQDLRRRVLKLTPKGEKLIRSVTRLMESK